MGVAWKEYAEGMPQWLRSVTTIVACAAALLYFGQRRLVTRQGGVGPTPTGEQGTSDFPNLWAESSSRSGGSEGDQLIAEGSGSYSASITLRSTLRRRSE